MVKVLEKMTYKDTQITIEFCDNDRDEWQEMTMRSVEEAQIFISDNLYWLKKVKLIRVNKTVLKHFEYSE